MATIVASTLGSTGTNAVTETTLTGTLDTFTYVQGKNQTLIFRNATAGALTPVLDGSLASTVPVAGVGTLDISAGYSVGSIAAGAVKAIRTESIYAYLQGTIAITGGTGLVAVLLEN